MSKTKWGPAVPVLWFIFIMTVAVIAYLSFENGEQSKLWTERIILRVIGKLKPEHNVTNAELLAITYVARQGARVIAFLFIGMLGTITVHASMRSAGWFVKTFISGGMVLFIAYATEAFKEYIPSRHFSHKEMLISILAVVAGFMFISLVSLLKQVIKWLFRFLE